MEKVKLPPFGRVGIVRPAPCIPATVTLAGQDAPPAAKQVTPLTVRLATAGSWNTAALPLAVEKVIPALLVITTVYVVVLPGPGPGLIVVMPSVLVMAGVTTTA